MTPEERHLWYDYLRTCPYRFQRQKILGNYIADFYCAEAKLVVELDGSQHYEPQNAKLDLIRTEFMEENFSLHILRIPNNAVKENFAGVCQAIEMAVQQGLAEK